MAWVRHALDRKGGYYGRQISLTGVSRQVDRRFLPCERTSSRLPTKQHNRYRSKPGSDIDGAKAKDNGHQVIRCTKARDGLYRQARENGDDARGDDCHSHSQDRPKTDQSSISSVRANAPVRGFPLSQDGRLRIVTLNKVIDDIGMYAELTKFDVQ